MASLTLSGCASTPKDRVPKPVSTGVGMPALRADLAVDCEDPGVREGRNAKVELARNRAWGKCERAKHRATVKFYDAIRAARPKT